MSAVLLDIGPSASGTLNRGHFYLNGFDLGRYWSVAGAGTTSPGQRFYILPPDLLIPDVEGGNALVLFDVLPGEGAGVLDAVQLVITTLVPVSTSTTSTTITA